MFSPKSTCVSFGGIFYSLPMFKERVLAMSVVGINGVDVIFDSERWGHLLLFDPRNGENKLHHRCVSGEWRDQITDEILLSSSFDHKNYIQPQKYQFRIGL